MKQQIKVYIAGKVNPASPHVEGLHWRDSFCKSLSVKTGFQIVSLDPVKSNGDFDFDQSNPLLMTGRNNFMIKQSDILIVNLTDDISVGGSTEIMVAKYFGIPVIGFAQPNGKFVRDTKVIQERIYQDFINPYVSAYCDFVATDIDAVVDAIKTIHIGNTEAKSITVIDEGIQYYLTNYGHQDSYLTDILGV